MIIIKNKKLLLSLSIFFITFLFTGCFLFNSSPVIESEPVTTAKEGAVYTYDVEATDPNEDTLTYSLTVSPTGMTINSTTGVIIWTPASAGSYDVIVEVSDGNKSTIQLFTITVGEAKLTSIEVSPSTMTIKQSNSQTITSITAYYDNDTSADIALSDCTYSSNNTYVTVANGVIKVLSSCTAATSAKITVSYTKNDVTKSDTVTVTVPAPASGG